MSNEVGAASLSISHVCRGEARIYALVTCPEDLGACALRAFSSSMAGEELPAEIVARPQEGDWVLMVPLIGAPQSCRVVALGEDGGVCAEVTHVFGQHVSRLRSMANTALKDEVVDQIRNYDRRSRDGALTMQTLRIIAALNGERIIHFQVDALRPCAADLEGEADVRVFDAAGHRLPPASVVVLKDSTSARGDYDGAWSRTVSCSLRVPGDMRSALVWVRLRGGAGLSGFYLIDEREFDMYASNWEWVTRDAGIDANYHEWFRKSHAATRAELDVQSRQALPGAPTFSIVVPLYRTPVNLLDEAVRSVLAQSYGRFQLVLVNSTPDDAELTRAVRAHADADDRITCVELPANLGITGNTNEGVKAATGDYVCFLDHDDLLAPDALYWYARTIDEHPEADLLYSDEDKVQDGYHFGPFFKPDWNPDLLESVNYVCHFLCVRKGVLDELGPGDGAYDGSQDHDLVLRVTERTGNVFHVPRVLYHWRVVPGSTAGGVGEKSYAFENGVEALRAHVERCGAKATVQANPRLPYGAGYEVLYEPVGEPLVSIVIPNKDNVDMLSRCIDSVFGRSTYGNFEVVVVENNSTEDETLAYYEAAQKAHDRLRVVTFDGAFNYSAVNNLGVKAAEGDYLLLLNNDTEVITPQWIERMLGLCMRDGTGAVGVKLVYPDRTVQHGGVIGLDSGPTHRFMYADADAYGYASLLQMRQDLTAVTAACMMVRRSAFEEVGGFDERFVVDYNDVALCLSLRDAGYLVVYEPGVELIHYESVSRGFHGSDASKVRFLEERGLLYRKWPAFVALCDPYSNPNLDATNAHGKGDWYR